MLKVSVSSGRVEMPVLGACIASCPHMLSILLTLITNLATSPDHVDELFAVDDEHAVLGGIALGIGRCVDGGVLTLSEMVAYLVEVLSRCDASSVLSLH